MKLGPTLTLVAIAGTAFFVADVAHEGLGHGGACVALGGKLRSLSTTYADCSMHSRWIDGAGPGMGILVALLAWGGLRWAPPRSRNMRAFLCLLFAFAIFWNVGYLVDSGLLDRGDWKFVVAGLEPVAVWRAGLVVGGVIFYGAAMRLLGGMLRRSVGDNPAAGWRPNVFALIALGGASALAAAGGALDPRGPATMLTDALPSALASFGLVWVGFVVHRRANSLRIAAPTSPAWIVLGFVCAALFIGVLGPGWRGSFL